MCVFWVRLLTVVAEVSPEHMAFGEQTFALVGFNWLLWRGGVVSSVGAGGGICGGVPEKAGRKTLRYRTEEILRQSRVTHQAKPE